MNFFALICRVSQREVYRLSSLSTSPIATIPINVILRLRLVCLHFFVQSNRSSHLAYLVFKYPRRSSRVQLQHH